MFQLDVYVSYDRDSKDSEYIEQAKKIESQFRTVYNVLTNQEYDSDYLECLSSQSTNKNTNRIFYFICYLIDDYAKSETCKNEIKNAAKHSASIIAIFKDDHRDEYGYEKYFEDNNLYEIKSKIWSIYYSTEHSFDKIVSSLIEADFRKAVRNSELDLLKYLLQKGAVDINARDDRTGQTAFDYAINSLNREVVDFLCEQGADINVKDGHLYESSPIKSAVYTGKLEFFKYICEKGANIHLKDKRGCTVLHDASSCFEIAKFLIENGVPINEKNNDGLTPLHIAASKGCLEIVNYFCENGADIHATDVEGETPLFKAGGNHVLDIMKCLLQKGASINVKSNDGSTLLHNAVRLHWGNLEIIKFLCAQGINVKEKTNDGETALYHCIHDLTENEDFKFLFYQATYDVDEKIKILQKALKYESRYIPNFLIQSIDINYKASDGSTLLHKVAYLGNEIEARKLVERGISINVKDINGKTPLHAIMDNDTSHYLDVIRWNRHFDTFKYLFTNQIYNNNFLEIIFDKDLQIQISQSAEQRDDLSCKTLMLKYMKEVNDWIASEALNKEIFVYNKLFFHEFFDPEIICQQEANDPHLMMCTVKLKCGHNACFKCTLKMILNIKRTVCRTCFCCVEMKLGDFFKTTIKSIWTKSNYKIDDFTNKSLKASNCRLLNLEKTKESINRKWMDDYINQLKYHEDALDIRVESIKIELNKIKKTVNKNLVNYINTLKNDTNEINKLYKLEQLKNIMKFSKEHKVINTIDIGCVTLQYLSLRNDDIIDIKVQKVEKNIYTKMDDTIIKDAMNSLKNSVQIHMWYNEIQVIRAEKYFESLMNINRKYDKANIKTSLDSLHSSITSRMDDCNCLHCIYGYNYRISKEYEDYLENKDKEVSGENECTVGLTENDLPINEKPFKNNEFENKKYYYDHSINDLLSKLEEADTFADFIKEIDIHVDTEEDLTVDGIQRVFNTKPFKKIEFENKKCKHHFEHLRDIAESSLNENNIEAVKCFKYCKLKTLVDNGIHFEKYLDNFNANALHLASLFGRNDIILWLYIKKFPFDTIDQFGFTALAYAAASDLINENRNQSTIVLLKLLGLNDIYKWKKPLLNYYLYCCNQSISVEIYELKQTIYGMMSNLNNAMTDIANMNVDKAENSISNIRKKHFIEEIIN